MNRWSCVAGVLFTLLLLNAAVSRGQEPEQKQPKMEVVDAYDWGVSSYEAVETEIEVRNVGDADLIIKEVRPGCGCTTSGIDKDTIRPGDVGIIHVTMRPLKPGPVTKWMRIFTNAPGQEGVYVWLRADFRRSLEIKPDQYFLVPAGVVGEEAVSEVRIINTGDEPFTVSPPELVTGNFEAQFNLTEDVELKPGEVARIRLTVVPTKTGPIAGVVHIATSHPTYGLLELSVYGTGDVQKASGENTRQSSRR